MTRLVDNERWNAKHITQMRGTPWDPVPGKTDRRIFVAIDENGNGLKAEDDEDQETDHNIRDLDDETELQFGGGGGGGSRQVSRILESNREIWAHRRVPSVREHSQTWNINIWQSGHQPQ